MLSERSPKLLEEVLATMSALRSEFLQRFQARGYLHQCTDLAALDAQMAEAPVVAYIGYDCTADSLHVGNLISIMMLRLLQLTGHKPIVLMGGGTTRVGDPSGKDASRQLLDDAAIARNMAGIKEVFAQFLTFGEGENDAVMVDNNDWLAGLNYIEFLRDYGRHFSVNRMLSFDSVKLRLDREQPLSFLEFNYMILQAYDFLELHRNHGCVLQMGGSDQWGNIVNGVELGRRVDGAPLFRPHHAALDHRFRRQDGQDRRGRGLAERGPPIGLRLLAVLAQQRGRRRGPFLAPFHRPAGRRDRPPRDPGGCGDQRGQEGPGLRGHQALPGPGAAAEAAAETARKTFEAGELSSDLPTITLPRADLEAGIAAFDLFRQAGLTASNGEARRLIKGGGARLNDQPIAEETRVVTLADLSADGVVKLSAGKKRHCLVRPEG